MPRRRVAAAAAAAASRAAAGDSAEIFVAFVREETNGGKLRAAEEWLREEVGKLFTDGAVTQIEVTTPGSASLRWGRRWDYPIAFDLRAGSDAGILVDGAACAGLLGDFRLLGMRPSVVVADDERSVVLAERRA